MIMESPVFISMLLLFLLSMKYDVKPFNVVTFTIFLFFQVHYIERSFIFPLLMKGNSKMPISIIFLGFFFNSCNAFMQGGWLFFSLRGLLSS
jgi:3-oxo-5-alpha-steroid 4-dehydrogenase 1